MLINRKIKDKDDKQIKKWLSLKRKTETYIDIKNWKSKRSINVIYTLPKLDFKKFDDIFSPIFGRIS